MNERIEKMWVDGTGCSVPRKGKFSSVGAVHIEKFVELIVKDCIKVCNSRVGNSDYNTGRMHCASDIKDHFGVE